jgi:hypothetical protein
MNGRPTLVTWGGLAVVLVAAAVLSFDALRGLALAVSIPERFAWLLPIAVDAGAAVSCAVWLGRRTPPDAARFAAAMTWALLALTVAGNAGQLGMHAHGIIPPWWVAVLVGAVPPAIVGGTVHLLVLLARTGPAERLDDDAPTAPAPAATPPSAEPPQGGDRVAALLAEGAGRRRLVKELRITEYQAKKVLGEHRAAQRHTAGPELAVNGRSPSGAGDGEVAR